ncbi:MAG: beta-ketoacyl-ACP synthase II [Anaerolineae bacterium]|nr:beta-ketoacyl-ACP synthase II [Anaerolineae bacterium]
MLARRVVITGMGILSPVGNTVEEAWNNIKQGKTGIAPIERFDTSHLEVKFGGEVKNFDPVAVFGRREARRTDRITQFALEATRQALEQAQLEITDANRWDIGVILGTGIGGLSTIQEGVIDFYTRGSKAISPLWVPMILSDSPAGKISIDYGIRGANWSLSSACSTGNNAIGEAAAYISRGSAEVMITGATEGGVIDIAVAAFNNMTAISRRNDDPAKASRPFDVDRDGFVMSEGAAVLILESLEFAEKRGAKILGEVVGYGATSDAYHVTAPDESGEGARRAMLMALKDANLTVNDIDYINAHGTSTPLNDKMETFAIKNAFGEQAYNVPVSSTKSMTGHVMGAAAAVEAVFCLKAIEEGYIPPTINLDRQDPELDLDFVPHEGRAKELNYVMSNSFGFGGHNMVAIFGKYKANGK